MFSFFTNRRSEKQLKSGLNHRVLARMIPDKWDAHCILTPFLKFYEPILCLARSQLWTLRIWFSLDTQNPFPDGGRTSRWNPIRKELIFVEEREDEVIKKICMSSGQSFFC